MDTKVEETLLDQKQETLLVYDKEKKSVNAVKGINEAGELLTTTPKHKNNNEFLKLDKHGTIAENFMKNFVNQLNDPTRFLFYRVEANKVEETAKIIQQHAKNPTPKSEEIVDKTRIQSNQSIAETREESMVQENSQNYYFVDHDKIDWDSLNNLGVTKEQLEKTNSLESMLRGYKSPTTFPIEASLGNITIRTDARLSFRPDSDGNVILAIHGIRNEPNLNRPYFGDQFSDEDKKNLLETGNMGRVAQVKNYITDEIIPSFISVDRQTNELVSMRADSLRIPDEIKGVKLDEEQKNDLREGKAIWLENMTSAKNTPFSAHIQVNADRRSLEFIFENNGQNQRQRQEEWKHNSDKVRIPKTLAGVTLTEKQQDALKGGKTLYIKGMIDREGQEYNAYVKVNPEKQKLDFYKFNPDKAKEKAKEVTPVEESKVQVAVNSEGKTNESTKKVKEPLKKEQAKPTEAQAKKQNKEAEKEQKQTT